jgi:hypothetical protein
LSTCPDRRSDLRPGRKKDLARNKTPDDKQEYRED